MYIFLIILTFFYRFFKYILLIQLSELEYYKARNAEMTEELYMYKSKVEKIPSLLAETARLRAYSNTFIYIYFILKKMMSFYKTFYF